MTTINNSNFEDWNEEMSKKYNPENYHRSSNFIVRFIENQRTNQIVKLIDNQKKDIIIEIGCGSGSIMQKIKKANQLWGIDLSDFMLKIARQKKYSVPIRLIKGNAEFLPDEITQLRFDKIYCSEVLEHVQNPDKVLSEIKKIAKSDSTIVVSIPNEGLINKIKTLLQKLRIFDIFFSGISKKMDDEWHLHSFNLDKLKELVKNDYIIRSTKGIPNNLLPLRYVVKMNLKQ